MANEKRPHEKMLNIISYERNANPNHNEIPLYPLGCYNN